MQRAWVIAALLAAACAAPGASPSESEEQSNHEYADQDAGFSYDYSGETTDRDTDYSIETITLDQKDKPKAAPRKGNVFNFNVPKKIAVTIEDSQDKDNDNPNKYTDAISDNAGDDNKTIKPVPSASFHSNDADIVRLTTNKPIRIDDNKENYGRNNYEDNNRSKEEKSTRIDHATSSLENDDNHQKVGDFNQRELPTSSFNGNTAIREKAGIVRPTKNKPIDINNDEESSEHNNYKDNNSSKEKKSIRIDHATSSLENDDNHQKVGDFNQRETPTSSSNGNTAVREKSGIVRPTKNKPIDIASDKESHEDNNSSKEGKSTRTDHATSSLENGYTRNKPKVGGNNYWDPPTSSFNGNTLKNGFNKPKVGVSNHRMPSTSSYNGNTATAGTMYYITSSTERDKQQYWKNNSDKPEKNGKDDTNFNNHVRITHHHIISTANSDDDKYYKEKGNHNIGGWNSDKHEYYGEDHTKYLSGNNVDGRYHYDGKINKPRYEDKYRTDYNGNLDNHYKPDERHNKNDNQYQSHGCDTYDSRHEDNNNDGHYKSKRRHCKDKPEGHNLKKCHHNKCNKYHKYSRRHYHQDKRRPNYQKTHNENKHNEGDKTNHYEGKDKHENRRVQNRNKHGKNYDYHGKYKDNKNKKLWNHTYDARKHDKYDSSRHNNDRHHSQKSYNSNSGHNNDRHHSQISYDSNSGNHGRGKSRFDYGKSDHRRNDRDRNENNFRGGEDNDNYHNRRKS